MILNAIYFSIFMPLSIQSAYAGPTMVAKPYVVKAVVDSARIIGFPSSRAAKDYAQRIQTPDQHITQLYQPFELVSWRRLFFREYFK